MHIFVIILIVFVLILLLSHKPKPKPVTDIPPFVFYCGHQCNEAGSHVSSCLYNCLSQWDGGYNMGSA